MTVSRTRKAIALVAAGPLLVALQLALIALDAPDSIVLTVALFAWFGGPVLLLTGAVMLLWGRKRWTLGPSTPTGRLALWLIAAFAACMFLFFLAVGSEIGPDDPQRFFDNLYLAIPLSLAAAFAVGAGALAGIALLFGHDRSLSLVGAGALGLIVALFAGTEIAGHEEPDSGPQLPNSQYNVAFANVAPGRVTVSFDYAYHHDPERVAITSITVSPLGSNQRPLAGYEPMIRPISRGTGHVEVTFAFEADQLGALQGFSICFTAPGHPDLGCAMTGYGPY